MSTVVKVQRPIIGAGRLWLIYDQLRARECTIPESDCLKEWCEWMGNDFKMFCIAEWNQKTKQWFLLSKTHWRSW